MMEKEIKKAILSALSFWGIFKYPLTADEIYENLLFYNFEKQNRKNLDIFEFRQILKRMTEENRIKNYKNLYYIGEIQDNPLNIRRKYYIEYRKKLELARKYTKYMALIPGIKAIALVNSVAMGLAQKNSDLDFLLITDKKSLWLSRFLLTLILKIFALRPNKNKMANTICVSFWLREDALNLSAIRFQFFDVYLFYWLNNVYFTYDSDKIQEKFVKANLWVKRFLPFANLFYNSDLIELNRSIENLKKIFVLASLDGLLKKYKKYIFTKEIRKKMNKSKNVIINDYMLKMHTVDNRVSFYQEYLKLYKNNKI